MVGMVANQAIHLGQDFEGGLAFKTTKVPRMEGAGDFNDPGARVGILDILSSLDGSNERRGEDLIHAPMMTDVCCHGLGLGFTLGGKGDVGGASNDVYPRSADGDGGRVRWPDRGVEPLINR